MGEELLQETSVPTLVFDVVDEEDSVLKAVSTAASSRSEVAFSDSVLSVEEQKRVDEFCRQIDLTNSNGILQFGVGTQKKMADFSETALENVRNKDLGEIGDMLSGVVAELKGFDAAEERGLLGFFKKSSNKIEALKGKYAKAEVSINKICKELETHQRLLLKDIAVLDKMYEQNLIYFKELTMYVMAGKQKLNEERNGRLRELVEKAKASGLAEDAQKAKDVEALCERFEKKLYDLELTRTIAMQTAPQIRLVQGSDTLMVEKIQSTIVNTVPLWKSQMVLALGVTHAEQAARAQREVTDMTNELLRKNADVLKTAAIESAKQSERGIVDIETLKHTNDTLITTFDEVIRIQTEGRAKRMEAEIEMKNMENALKNKLLEFNNH